MLNRIWYDGAYTANLNQLPAHTSSGAWSIQQVQISINGQVVWNNGVFQATSGVTGASGSAGFVDFSVSGGSTYLVTTNP